MSAHVMEKVLREILEKNFMAVHNLTSEIPSMLQNVPDEYKTKEMCEKAVSKDPHMLKYVPNRYKTQAMCSKAVLKEPELLEYVPNRLKKLIKN